MPLIQHSVELAAAPAHLDLDAAIQGGEDATYRGDRATRGVSTFDEGGETLTDLCTPAQIRLAPAAPASEHANRTAQLRIVQVARMTHWTSRAVHAGTRPV